jgi:hypothetical protein
MTAYFLKIQYKKMAAGVTQDIEFKPQYCKTNKQIHELGLRLFKDMLAFRVTDITRDSGNT